MFFFSNWWIKAVQRLACFLEKLKRVRWQHFRGIWLIRNWQWNFVVNLSGCKFFKTLGVLISTVEICTSLLSCVKIKLCVSIDMAQANKELCFMALTCNQPVYQRPAFHPFNCVSADLQSLSVLCYVLVVWLFKCFFFTVFLYSWFGQLTVTLDLRYVSAL